MRLNKRACRKLADPTWKMNLNSGLFCADQLQYIVRSAVRNVDEANEKNSVEIGRAHV